MPQEIEHIIGKALRKDRESLPPDLKRLVDVASRFDLRARWHIVASDEEESGVHKYKLPNRSLRRRRFGRIGRMEPPCAKTWLSVLMFAPKATSTM